MDLKEFATKCGVEVFTLESIGKGYEINDWGGPFGWKSKDTPSCKWLGFASEEACYVRWMEQTFGQSVAPVIYGLLNREIT